MKKSSSEIIDAMGGNQPVAALCELHPAAVSAWRKRGIPRHWRKFLAEKYPDIFQPPEPIGQACDKNSDV